MFLTSDTHFGHKNVIKYDDRPFDSIEEMNETLIENWNSVVKPAEMVWHLGDFAMTGSQNAQRIFDRLNGRKVLIRGNHDKKPSQMWRMGWEQIYDIHTMNIEDQQVIMSHFPYPTNSEWEKEHPGSSWSRPNNAGLLLLCGHSHPKKGEHLADNMFNVGCSAHDYTPVHIEEIRAWVRSKQSEM